MNKIKNIIKSKFGKAATAVLVLIGGVLIMQLLANTEKVSNKKEIIKTARKVDVIAPKYQNYQLEITGNGTIKSVNELTITSAVRGPVIYSKNNLKAGTYIQKDEILVKIDPREAENMVYLARANLINAIVSLIPDFVSSRDKKYYDKWNTYLSSLDIENKTPDLPNVAEQREKIKVSLRNIYGMYYNVKNAELQLSYHLIRAPFDGFITTDGILNGSFVNPGQTLAILHDAENLEINVPLAISDFNLLDIKEGNPVFIYGGENNEKIIEGSIKRFNTALNTNSQSVSVFVGLNNSLLNPSYFPGNYVTIKIPGRKLTNVCRLPRHLINPDGELFIADSFRLQEMEIDILATQDEFIFTNTVIPSDIRIITTNLQKAIMGMDIRFEDPLK
ncbi:MAG: HlyD family efflux transporter periplasmic adaptor subunit [Candidatus Marinimicrobia bacterium]|nr:HlyD family efflux transporter periplasmic adaptor subunit [Candidatus Neomarinimicrobiota bacterium]